MALQFGTETVTVALKDGESCEISKRFSQGDINDLTSAMSRGIKINIGGDMKTLRLGNLRADELITASTFAALLVGVKSWSFRYPEDMKLANGKPDPRAGKPVPVNAETLRMLDPEDYETIALAIADRNKEFKPRMVEEKNA